jgi:hypothetical protein
MDSSILLSESYDKIKDTVMSLYSYYKTIIQQWFHYCSIHSNFINCLLVIYFLLLLIFFCTFAFMAGLNGNI